MSEYRCDNCGQKECCGGPIGVERDRLKSELEQVKTHHRYDLEQFRKCQDRLSSLQNLAHRMAEAAIAFTSDIHNREKVDKLSASVAAFRASSSVSENDVKGEK